MSKLSEEDFIKLANKIYISPDKKTLEYLKVEYNEINEGLEKLKLIDIEGVEPLTRISKNINFLREDIVDESIKLEKQVALNNAKEKDNNFIIMKRILK